MQMYQDEPKFMNTFYRLERAPVLVGGAYEREWVNRALPCQGYLKVTM